VITEHFWLYFDQEQKVFVEGGIENEEDMRTEISM
jgi:hypothetical protein